MKLYTDGACSGNPGPASIAYIAYDGKDNKIVCTHAEYVGERTNNVAEIMAIFKALCYMVSWSAQGVIFSDSLIAIDLINKTKEVHDETLKGFVDRIHEIIKGNEVTVGFRFTPRENNTEADALCNKIIKEYRVGK